MNPSEQAQGLARSRTTGRTTDAGEGLPESLFARFQAALEAMPAEARDDIVEHVASLATISPGRRAAILALTRPESIG